MPAIRLEATFRPSSDGTVGRMCRISPDLAGYPLRHDFNGHKVELIFPPLTLPLPCAGYFNAQPHDANRDYMPDHLYPASLSANAIFVTVSDPDSPEYKREFQSAFDALRTAATRLSDSIRVIQPAVGLAGECPAVLDLTAHDTKTGEAIRVPVARKQGYGIEIGNPVLTVERAVSALETGTNPTESLLAQATYLSRLTSDPQPGLAILLAAVACESQAKEVLLARAEIGVRPLLETLLHRPRIFQEPAAELYGHVAKSVIGRSLHDDNITLWKQITELFQLRNKMAHMANIPSVEKAKDLVIAAAKAVEWLNLDNESATPQGSAS
jgi:hypothetical protein